MMHEYAKDIKQEPRTAPAKPFIVRKFRTLKEVCECLERYQEETVTHFIKYNKDKKFGNEDYIPNIERGRIHYWSHTGKCGVPIEYDGVPFMHVGRWVLMCHQGQDINRRHKEKYQMRKHREQQESGVAPKSRNRSQVTKKVNCPAEIYVTHIMKFPQHKVPNALLAIDSLPTDHMRKLAKKKIISSFKRYSKRFVRESWYYVRLPDPTSHKGHPVLGLVKQESAPSLPAECTVEISSYSGATIDIKRKRHSKSTKFRTKEPVDPRVLQKMYELTRQGVSTVKMMQEAIAEYVREELFPCGEPPPTMYRRYNPTSSDIQNAMYKVKQEMRLEGKSILQYRCAALVREITELVVQTDSEDYLNQLEEQLRNIYNAIRNTVPIQEVQFRPEQEGDKGKQILGDGQFVTTLPIEGEPKAKRGRRRRNIEQQAELNAATYHLKLENQQLQTGDQQMELEGVLEHHQVHEIIQQEDGTITEVYYYQPIDQYDQYVEQEQSENQQYQSDAIIIQPQDIKTEPPQIDQL
ncbi:calcium-responsive transcription factor-like [Panulirus ornatus]|uniref:calcium-responsive transcription factor-like n=1 Tax=Panulirus ornatus TaxID=150431 RepID=UPI003A87EB72